MEPAVIAKKGTKVQEKVFRDEDFTLDGPKKFQVINHNPTMPKAYLGVRPFYRYISRVDGKAKFARYVTGVVRDPKNTDLIVKYLPDDIGFRRGTRTVDVLEAGLYKFLMEHPENASNPHRPVNVAPTFELIDPDGAARAQLAFDEKVVEAFAKVNFALTGENAAQMTEDLCVHLNINFKQSPDLVKAALLQAAQRDPELVLEFEGVDWEKIRDLFGEALKYKLLVFRSKTFSYAWSNKVQPLAGKQEIVKFDRNHGSAKEQFVQYLGSNRGQLVFSELQSRVGLMKMEEGLAKQGGLNPAVKKALEAQSKMPDLPKN